jgi:hypothetical protein
VPAQDIILLIISFLICSLFSCLTMNTHTPKGNEYSRTHMAGRTPYRATAYIANGVNSPLGGAHLIFAGDMRQLKAVKSVALYEKPPLQPSDPTKTEYFDLLQAGRQRYMEITHYIELTKNFRQEESRALGDCLGRCRTNSETTADLALLNTRFMPNAEQTLKDMQLKRQAICLASTKQVVNDIKTKFHDSLVSQGNRAVTCFALHRVSISLRTRAVDRPVEEVDQAGDGDDFASSRLIDNNTRLESGLNESQRLLCLNYDSNGNNKSKVNASCIKLAIGSRVMLLQNVGPLLGLVNGTTGTVVGFVYSTVEGANPICERPDVSTAARLEPQIPVVLMRVDEEFWKAPEHNFTINPPLPKKENWERVIAIPPVESRSVFKMKFQGGQKKSRKFNCL